VFEFSKFEALTFIFKTFIYLKDKKTIILKANYKIKILDILSCRSLILKQIPTTCTIPAVTTKSIRAMKLIIEM